MRLNNFRFIDSLSFLNASLDELMQDLVKDEKHPFKILDQTNLYPQGSKLKKLLLRKGIFCYDYCTSIESLSIKKIPEQKHFYNKLKEQDVSLKDWEHANTVFKDFKCENLKEYLEMYCLTDTAILCEVFLQFRKITFENFGLDCAWYISTPQVRNPSVNFLKP
jgi:hypothetical protein